MKHGTSLPVLTSFLALLILTAMVACTPASPPTNTPTTSPPAGTPITLPPATPSQSATAAPATPSTTAPSDLGYLEGHATIGPLTPVERVGVPTLTPSPDVCTSRGLTVYEADGKTPVMAFNLSPDCTYRVALKAGTYVVGLSRTQSVGGSKDLPKTIHIESGRTLRLDVSIDTGIR